MSNKKREHKAERARCTQTVQELMNEIAALRERIYALDDPTDLERYGEHHERLDELVNKWMRLQRDKRNQE